MLQEYRLAKFEQSSKIFNWTSESYWRTNSYSSHYGKVYHKNYFLSIHYSTHWYEAGAMHGFYGFRGFNFILNPLVQIDSIKSLFVEAEYVFKKISDYTRKILLDIPAEIDESGKPVGEEKLLEKEFVENGTSEWGDFEIFVFSEDGLEISFSAYCVGAYATGPQFVTIPYEIFKEDLVPHIRLALQV
jgi:hypothetical protein